MKAALRRVHICPMGCVRHDPITPIFHYPFIFNNMKNIIVICFIALLGQTAFAQTTGMVKKKAASVTTAQTAQFQVWGNCGMCKKTIEKAAKSVDGVASADWNVDTHQFNVSFDPAKTSTEKVHQAIAAAGYDTDLMKGNDEAYKKLHGCCQYERKE